MSTTVSFNPLPFDLSDVRYEHGPDSTKHPGVPTGTVTRFTVTGGAGSSYPGTTRTVQVYVPHQYDPTVPPSLLVCQDGSGFLDPHDDLRAGVVLDNLIHRGDIAPLIGVFVDPGTSDDVDVTHSGRNPQRNAEYDAFDDRYATFLVHEVLPEVTRRWTVTEDHDRWVIGGFSSGASCAFTVAWLCPDVFRRVLCFLPSFAQIRGGNPYPELTVAKRAAPMSVFVQASHRDLGWDEPDSASWLAEDLRVVAGLVGAGHDVRLVVGDGPHDSLHAGVLLPDALRWLLRPEDGSPVPE